MHYVQSKQSGPRVIDYRGTITSLEDKDLKEIRIFSRDEKKQEDLRIKFNKNNIKFYLADVRDY